MNPTHYRQAERAWWQHAGLRPQERWLDLPMARVRVLESGEGAPLLFVHGGPAAASIFAPLAAQLPDRRCLLLDRPGCGISAPWTSPATSPPESMAALLTACLDALEIDRCDLAASSLGGACALWLALRAPDRVGHITLLGCPPFISATRIPLFLRLLATPVVGSLLLRLPANRSATLGFLKTMGQTAALAEQRIPEAFIDWWTSLGRDTATMRNEHAIIRRALDFRGMRAEFVIPDDVLGAMDVSMSLFWGDDDPFADFSDVQALLPRHTRSERVPAAGHLPWLDAPARAATHIRTHAGGQPMDWRVDSRPR